MALRLAAQLPPPARTLGGRIKQARSYQGLSQDDLIEAMVAAHEDAPSRRTLSTWENDKGSPQVDTLLAIAAATKFPVEWFVIDLRDDAGPSGDGPASVEYAPWDSNPEPVDCTIIPMTRRFTATLPDEPAKRAA